MITRRLMSVAALAAILPGPVGAQPPQTAAGFVFAPLMGARDIALGDYAGKVVLVVNTASQCGYTPQYEGLEALYRRRAGEGLVVIGVPSNDFGAQEPGSAREIARFCRLNYGVTFPMAAKARVVGDDALPFYRWAHTTLGESAVPRWNFHKILIGRDGRLIAAFPSAERPDGANLSAALDRALATPAPLH